MLVRVLLHAHHRNVILKPNANYSICCNLVETRSSLLTLRKLDTQRVFTADYDAVAVCRITVTSPAALLALVARAASSSPSLAQLLSIWPRKPQI